MKVNSKVVEKYVSFIQRHHPLEPYFKAANQSGSLYRLHDDF